MSRLVNAFRGSNLSARLARSTSWVIVGYGGTQAIRLASNLILTRILFPEAFGIMALVTMVIVGLMMFSDVGIGPAVARSPRGDDPAFLDTAWTVQAVRGAGLWLLTLLVALPFAHFYGRPELALYLPVAGLSLIASGLLPTRVKTARRHLLMGRVTALDLLSQLIGVGLMVLLALATRSVFALVAGGVLSALANLFLTWRFLPGHRDRFRIERPALRELIHFGKWIFLGTAFTFLSMQGDKAVLGKLLPLEVLGIYNIGFFLASFPMMLGHSVAQDLLISVYRDRPPRASPENRRKLRRMRALISAGICGLLLLMAYIGPPLVSFLYDDRYHAAGAMMVLIACGLLPKAIGVSYDRAALAAGDSRGAFIYAGLQSVTQITLLIVGLMSFGLIGGLVSQGLAVLAVYPLLIRLARRHEAWDAVHDGTAFAIATAGAAGAVWLHHDAIVALSSIVVN